MNIKKYKKIGEQSLVFVGIYALSLLILSISRTTQTALSFDSVINTATMLTPNSFTILGITSLLLYGLFFTLRRKK